MKKVIESKKVRFDKTELTKCVLYKLEDADDATIPKEYFTLRALKIHVAEYLWDYWQDIMGDTEKQDYTKMEIIGNDEFLFAYLESWNYKVTRITYQDIK
jgi:hypothetical protein